MIWHRAVQFAAYFIAVAAGTVAVRLEDGHAYWLAFSVVVVGLFAHSALVEDRK